jgi:hypothetical protein
MIGKWSVSSTRSVKRYPCIFQFPLTKVSPFTMYHVTFPHTLTCTSTFILSHANHNFPVTTQCNSISHIFKHNDITSSSHCPKNKHRLLTQSISKQILRREKQDIPAATAVQTFLNPVTPLHLSEAIFTLPYILGKILDGQTRDGKSVTSPRPTHSI